ncbi:dihydrodipicolinate reductase [Yoonia sp.]|uniref:dihydrodipicolinate reductase n=1 Tax=Yoonia sp. TaxID=2212373 RepID=UPI002FDAB0A7
MKHLALTTLLAVSPLAALADGFAPVKDAEQFVSLVSDRELRIYLYGLTLRVKEEGTIEGSAVGTDITGTWSWQDGYFCREMAWGTYEIPYNCQLVEVRGNDRMRFTVDQGAGDSATFRLQ